MEADEVKFGAPPRHAHECKTWLLSVVDALVAAAGNADKAMPYGAKLLSNDAKFEELVRFQIWVQSETLLHLYRG